MQPQTAPGEEREEAMGEGLLRSAEENGKARQGKARKGRERKGKEGKGRVMK